MHCGGVQGNLVVDMYQEHTFVPKKESIVDTQQSIRGTMTVYPISYPVLYKQSTNYIDKTKYPHEKFARN